MARIGVLSGNGRAQSNSNAGSFNTRPVLQPTHKVMQASSQPGGQMLQACIPSSSRFISRSNNHPATSNSVESSDRPNKIAGLPNISLAPGQSAVFSDFKQFLDSYRQTSNKSTGLDLTRSQKPVDQYAAPSVNRCSTVSSELAPVSLQGNVDKVSGSSGNTEKLSMEDRDFYTSEIDLCAFSVGEFQTERHSVDIFAKFVQCECHRYDPRRQHEPVIVDHSRNVTSSECFEVSLEPSGRRKFEIRIS